jgi:photosystem II protein|mmetsp:Transcript_65415/g.108817  ORF Transcript_65415/g.108817 Transcript_65415/m.108817 type:complete len:244 (+) Transcript_65415:53-784(+)|eukprot:CAMPEP_0174280788 /NCGR_PEP_ID=MMETSP0809-20121228/1090_1 /TAXON_ID=73025 ORGANISM="Eutreptiella gymnastica-like, Strain CCMP1594" /NCGR_SAMPLE_ID=MMETSP0809 /ASSEMBLY_ACC=CAM_ASM_000658 /LENGTH=243 /DNA_ID=CAMNT_0015373895 /DNA_START=42 /DNA_END=773 /DNA_ORIENTATION=-
MQYSVETSSPNKWAIGGVACATTALVAAATYALTANTGASALYTAQAVRPATQVTARMSTMTRAAQQPQAAFAAQAQEQAQAPAAPAFSQEFAPVNVATVASAPNSGLLVASFSAMLLAVASALGAAFGYRSETVAMASGGGARSAKKGGSAQGGQAGVGYKGSTIAGSAPTTRSGKPGFVYKLGVKNGLGNVDEYSPVYNQVEWKSDGDTYEPGLLGLAVWAAGFLTLLGVSGFLIYYTSAL